MLNVIEFWTTETAEGEQGALRLLARLHTEAAPPPVDAIINIQSQDWTVKQVDYSIDHEGKQYRRNVFLG